MAESMVRSALKQTGAYFTGDGRCKFCQQNIEWWQEETGRQRPRDPGTLTVHFATCPARPKREKKERPTEPELFPVTNVIEFRPRKP